MDEEAFEMWFNNHSNLTVTPPSPAFTLYGSQNDIVDSHLCSDLSSMRILHDNHYHAGIGTSTGPQHQHQHPSPSPSWLHFHNNLLTQPIAPPPCNDPKRTFTKEQAFGESQVDSFPNNVNFGNTGSSSSYGRGWGDQRSQLQNQSFESFPYMCSSRESFISNDLGTTNSFYLFPYGPVEKPTPGYREIQLPPRQIIRRHSSPFGCGCSSICCAATRNSFQKEEVPFSQMISRFHGESSKNSGIDFIQQQQQQCMIVLRYEDLVRLQGLSMFEMAKDQSGCRLLQNSFDGENIQNMMVVFNGIIDYVIPLMMDPFGNYLVQKLLDFCFDYQRLKIVLMLTTEPAQLVTVSFNTHGTRVVQKLIKSLKTDMEIHLLRSAIQPGFLQLINDLNGNHVIQTCLQYLSVQDNEFIFDAATKFCVKVATHQHGCCVLQRCIEYSKGRSQEKLVKEICKHGLLLARDQFGNFVVQYVIKMENLSSSAKFTLTTQFEGNYVDLSKQKFSSHVVETCLEYIPEIRSSVVHEFLSVANFEHLMQHPFANYVIQRALLETKGHIHRSLAEAVRQHKKLHTSPYCKKMFSKNLLKK